MGEALIVSSCLVIGVIVVARLIVFVLDDLRWP